MGIIKDRKGLTLVEMLVSITITVLLLGALSLFIIRSFDINRYTIEQGMNIAVLQNSLRNFSANLREARQSEDGDYLLKNCDEYEVTFYADPDNDGVAEQLTYYLENSQFKLEIVEPDLGVSPPSYNTGTSEVKIIGNGVVNGSLSEPIFYYYEEDGEYSLEEGFAPSQVELVRIRIYANIDTDEVPDSMLMETMVRPRNIP